jgi:hypothetical protein
MTNLDQVVSDWPHMPVIYAYKSVEPCIKRIPDLPQMGWRLAQE